jgi:hypothetical protein
LTQNDKTQTSLNLSPQEKDLQLFLDSIGVRLPADDFSKPDDYHVIRLHPEPASLFDAHENKAVLLSYRISGRVFPISVIFLKKGEGMQFCHSSLLLESYAHQEDIVPVLRQAVADFFSLDFNTILGNLEPSWIDTDLTGQLDCRIYWTAKPDMKVVSGLFLEKLGEVPDIPLFPTVYYYNNPYDENLLEAALPDMDGCGESLMLGCGAGLEAICVALKYGVLVDAVDINPIAVANTMAACRRTGTDQLVHAWVSNGWQKVEKSYDAILFEAPLATNEPQVTDPNRYDFGGKLLKEILSGLPAHLNSGGRMYLMSCPDLTPYIPANGLKWKALRYFEAKSQVAIHKVWLE